MSHQRSRTRAKDQLFRNLAAHRHCNLGLILAVADGQLIALRQGQNQAQRTSARNDRRLMDRIVVGTFRPTIAWPASWYAVIFFSSSVITIERRSAPIITLSLAFSKSIIVTKRRPIRAAVRAASFTRFARSAPEKPGVPRAIMRKSTSGPSGVLRA